jgi:hypothetical protein
MSGENWSEWSATPSSHHEFGYLCPSAHLRKRLRAAVASIAVSLLIGVTAALAHRAALDGGGREQALTPD